MQRNMNYIVSLLTERKDVTPSTTKRKIPSGIMAIKMIRNVKSEPVETTSYCVAVPKVRNLPHLPLDSNFALLYIYKE